MRTNGRDSAAYLFSLFCTPNTHLFFLLSFFPSLPRILRRERKGGHLSSFSFPPPPLLPFSFLSYVFFLALFLFSIVVKKREVRALVRSSLSFFPSPYAQKLRCPSSTPSCLFFFSFFLLRRRRKHPVVRRFFFPLHFPLLLDEKRLPRSNEYPFSFSSFPLSRVEIENEFRAETSLFSSLSSPPQLLTTL